MIDRATALVHMLGQVHRLDVAPLGDASVMLTTYRPAARSPRSRVAREDGTRFRVHSAAAADVAAAAGATTGTDGTDATRDDIPAPDDELGGLVATLREMDGLMARAVRQARALDGRRAAAEEGMTVDGALRLHTGQTRSDVSMLLGAAEVLAHMPVSAGLFDRGVLSWGHVRALVAGTRAMDRDTRRVLDGYLGAHAGRLERLDSDGRLAAIDDAIVHHTPLRRVEERAERDDQQRLLVLCPRLDSSGTLFGDLDAEGSRPWRAGSMPRPTPRWPHPAPAMARTGCPAMRARSPTGHEDGCSRMRSCASASWVTGQAVGLARRCGSPSRWTPVSSATPLPVTSVPPWQPVHRGWCAERSIGWRVTPHWTSSFVTGPICLLQPATRPRCPRRPGGPCVRATRAADFRVVEPRCRGATSTMWSLVRRPPRPAGALMAITIRPIWCCCAGAITPSCTGEAGTRPSHVMAPTASAGVGATGPPCPDTSPASLHATTPADPDPGPTRPDLVRTHPAIRPVPIPPAPTRQLATATAPNTPPSPATPDHPSSCPSDSSSASTPSCSPGRDGLAAMSRAACADKRSP